MNDSHTQLGRALVQWLRARPGGAVVALSGGVDSALVLSLAVDAYGADAVVAATSRSESLPRRDLDDGLAQAQRLGVRHEVLSGSEVDVEAFRRNAPDRCFHCKDHLYGEMRAVADRRGLAHVIDGTNGDDAGDHRPGLAAAMRLGVLSPLLALGVSKERVRGLAQARGIHVWDKPANACLASRFPYGTHITREALARVARCERALHDVGLPSVRVRVHGAVARIEVPVEDLPVLLEPSVRERVVLALRAESFEFVSLDLEGFRSGSLNAR